ncbi:MAG: hypothetical protein ACYS9X_30640, partial [Planctomycetota bacterium]
LVGAEIKLDEAARLRTRLDGVKVARPEHRPGRKRLDWRPLLKLAKDRRKSDAPKVWRTHGWTKEMVPALDNLEPAGREFRGWYLPGFDDSKWQKKTAPFRVHKSHRMDLVDHPVGHHSEMYQIRPLYNAFARTRFNLPNAEDAGSVKALRVVIQNGHQYLRSEVYLNGYRVAAILRPNSCELAPEAAKLLKARGNCLAVFLSSIRGHLHDFDFGIDAAR